MCQPRIIRRRFVVKILQLLRDARAHRQLVEIRPRVGVLLRRPRHHRRLLRLLQPLIVIRDLDAVILVHHRLARRGYLRLRGEGDRNGDKGKKQRKAERRGVHE